MTTEEFQRWRDFAARMARHGWPKATDARKAKIEECCTAFIDQYKDAPETVGGWDGSEAGVYICDDITWFFGLWGVHLREDCEDTRFETQVSCCVRAGLDVTGDPSMGVVGFTVDTLRRMYDGEIPAWLTDWFEPPLPADAPGSEGVWL